MPNFNWKPLPPLPELDSPCGSLAPAPLSIGLARQQRFIVSAQVDELRRENATLRGVLKQKENEIAALKDKIDASSVALQTQSRGITDAIQTTCSAFRRYQKIAEEAASTARVASISSD